MIGRMSTVQALASQLFGVSTGHTSVRQRLPLDLKVNTLHSCFQKLQPTVAQTLSVMLPPRYLESHPLRSQI